MFHDIATAFKQTEVAEIIKDLKADFIRVPDAMSCFAPTMPPAAHLYIVAESDAVELYDAIPLKNNDEVSHDCYRLVPLGDPSIPGDISSRMLGTPWKALKAYSAVKFSKPLPVEPITEFCRGPFAPMPMANSTFIIVSDKIFDSMHYVMKIFSSAYLDHEHFPQGLPMGQGEPLEALRVATALSWIVAAEKADQHLHYRQPTA